MFKIFVSFFFSQINIDKFDVGRFTSHTNDGCPDGFMTITEEKLATNANAYAFDPINTNNDGDPNNNKMGGDGKWCGNAWGYNVYYSENSSINITMKLFKLTQQQQQLGLSANSNNFSFRLTYKFLKRGDAKLR